MKSAASKVALLRTPDAPPTKQAVRRNSVEALTTEVKESLGDAWLPRFYVEHILTLRTRSHQVTPAAKKASVEVQHTLLGVELKVGRRRMSCPDLATARYLAVFARAGCNAVAVPYDITKISRLADDLESSWQRMLLLLEHKAGERSRAVQTRARTFLIAEARREIERAGAGTPIPQFNQNTRQRPRRVE